MIRQKMSESQKGKHNFLEKMKLKIFIQNLIF